MGLLDGLLGGGRMGDPVRGTAQVVACSGYHGRGVMQSCHMQLVAQAEGVPATAVEFDGLVHNKRWPSPGMVLPATIDRADPRRVKIEWDEVASSEDRSRQTAEGLAAALRARSAPTVATDSPPPEGDVDDQLVRLERLGKLRDEGILTEAEFAEQKRRILGD